MEIVYYVAASLDGFIATPQGGIDWLKPFEGGPEDYGYQGFRRAWLVGGAKLAAAFRAEGLISEYIISVIPVLLGSGIALFDGPGPKQDLRLAGSKSYDNGIIQLRYLAIRAPGG